MLGPRWADCRLLYLALVVPDMYVAVVECGQHPWLLGMQVHALDTVRP